MLWIRHEPSGCLQLLRLLLDTCVVLPFPIYGSTFSVSRGDYIVVIGLFNRRIYFLIFFGLHFETLPFLVRIRPSPFFIFV